jgi:transposase-like protein
LQIPRQYYTEEFKQEAVKLIRESSLKLSEAASRLNIYRHAFLGMRELCINRWHRQGSYCQLHQDPG